MRNLMMIPLILAVLSACSTTPAQRCVGYTGAIMRYEGMLNRGEVLTEVQRGAYDIALAGQAATCDLTPVE